MSVYRIQIGRRKHGLIHIKHTLPSGETRGFDTHKLALNSSIKNTHHSIRQIEIYLRNNASKLNNWAESLLSEIGQHLALALFPSDGVGQTTPWNTQEIEELWLQFEDMALSRLPWRLLQQRGAYLDEQKVGVRLSEVPVASKPMNLKNANILYISPEQYAPNMGNSSQSECCFSETRKLLRQDAGRWWGEEEKAKHLRTSRLEKNEKSIQPTNQPDVIILHLPARLNSKGDLECALGSTLGKLAWKTLPDIKKWAEQTAYIRSYSAEGQPGASFIHIHLIEFCTEEGLFLDERPKGASLNPMPLIDIFRRWNSNISFICTTQVVGKPLALSPVTFLRGLFEGGQPPSIAINQGEPTRHRLKRGSFGTWSSWTSQIAMRGPYFTDSQLIELDRTHQSQIIRGVANDWIKNTKTLKRALGFFWQGNEGQGVDIFHQRVQKDLEDAAENRATVWAVEAEWPHDGLDFQDELLENYRESFGLDSLSQLATEVSLKCLHDGTNRLVLYVGHTFYAGSHPMEKEMVTFLKCWTSDFMEKLPEGVLPVFGIGFTHKSKKAEEMSHLFEDGLKPYSRSYHKLQVHQLAFLSSINAQDLMEFFADHQLPERWEHLDGWKEDPSKMAKLEEKCEKRVNQYNGKWDPIINALKKR